MMLRLLLVSLINLIVSGVAGAQIIKSNNESNMPSIAPNNLQPTFIPTLYMNDKPYDFKCPKGSFIAEIIPRGGSGIDRFYWKCSDGSFSIKLGTSLGGGNFPVLKSKNGFVKAVFTDMTSLAIGCKTSPWYGAYTNFYDANNTVYNIPGRIRECPTPTFICPLNQVFTGFSGRSGVYLTQVYIAYCDYLYETYAPTQLPTISSLSTFPTILSPCKSGFYRLLNSSSNSCIPCGKGAYSVYGAVSCTLCPMHTYANTTASSSCYPCQIGTYTSTIGSTACQSIITKDTFCLPFSASNTFWGTRNSPICKIRACAGDTLKLSTVTGGGFCRQDTYAILKNSTGAILSISDDFKNPSFYCSEILYTVPLLNVGQGSTPQCQDYTLVQGCYSYNCSGQYNVQIRNAFNMPYAYVGCYGDVKRIHFPNYTDAMITLSTNFFTKSIDECFDLANSMGYTYFGLFGGGGFCFGSNDLTRATQYGKCPYSTAPGLEGTVCDCFRSCVYGDPNCGTDFAHSLFQIFSFAKALSIVPSRKPTFKPTVGQAIATINLNCTILGFNLTSFVLSSSSQHHQKCFANNMGRYIFDLGTYLFDIPVCGVPSPISCTRGVFPSGTMSSRVTVNSGTYDGNTWSIGVYQNKPALMVFYQNGDVYGNEPMKSKVVIVCNSLLTKDRITQSNTRPFHAVVIMETPNHDICNSNIQAPFVPYTYVGCYGNTASNAMTFLYNRLFSSPRECRDYSQSKNYRYFALSINVLFDNQFQCYGSNDLVASTKYGACATGSTGTVKNCVCDQSCENGEDCGGIWANTIYEIWYTPTFAPTMTPTLPTVSPTFMPSSPTCSPSFLPTAVPTQLYVQEWKVRVTSSLHTKLSTDACHVVEMTATNSDTSCELVSAMLACQSHIRNYLATTELPGRVKLICNVYMDKFTSSVLMNVALASNGAFLNFVVNNPDFHPTNLVDINVNLFGNKNVIVGGNTYRFIAANIDDGNEKITLSLYDITLENFGSAALLSDGGAMNLKTIYNNLNLYLNAVNVIRCQSSTNGGGLTLSGLSSVIIVNSTFSDNSANINGGAIYATRSNVVIANSVIKSNNANQNGGGLYFLNTTNSKIMSTTITKNTASLNGGGLYIVSTKQLNINTETVCSENIALIGGCIYVQSSSNIKITNSLFTSNIAAGLKGAGVYVTDSSLFQLISSTITKNSIVSASRSDLSGAGAGIFLINSPNAFLSNLTVVANTNPPSGGGAYIYNCAYLKFQNSFIGSNQAYYQGGGVHMENSMYASFVNNTWVDNQVSSVAAALYVYNSNFVQFTQSIVKDNIAGGDSGGLYFEKCLNATLSHSDFNGNTGSGGGGLTLVDNTYLTINNITTNANNGYRGGGINMLNCRFTRVSDSTFIEDKAVWGGAFFIDNCRNTTLSDIRINRAVSVNKGSGVYAQFTSGLLVKDSIITNCNAAIGAGVYVFTSTNTFIDNATITLNTASDLSLGGGGVFFDHCITGVIKKSAIFSNSARNGGGGCYIYFSDHITIASTMLSDNNVLGNGGGLLVQSSDNFKLVDSNVISNKVNNLGGGLYITSSTSFTTTRTNFKTNFAMGSSGGGMYISQCSKVVLEMSTFDTNSAPNNNGAGGALYITLSDQLKFNKLNLQNNFAEGNGGGIFVSFSGPLQILSCHCNSNEAHANGAAIYMTSNTPSSNTVISGNIFTSNRAVLNGGALFMGTSKSIVIADNIFNENSVSSVTDGSGGGAYLTSVQNTLMKNNSFQSSITGAVYGSGIYMLNSQNVTVSQSQISHHKAIQGAGMFVSLCSGLVIKNSVFSRNTASKFGGGFFIDKSTISFSRVSITNNYAAVSGGGVYSATQSNLNFDSTNLTFNVASEGGSVFMNTRIKSVLRKSIFHSNQATTGGGGSIKAMASCDIAISDTIFLNEKCQLAGGAIDIISNSKLNILRSTFTSCSSLSSGLGDGGGALYIGTNITSMIDSSTFTQNSANKCSAISYKNATKFTILNSNFNNNKAKVYGGSLCLVNTAIGLINNSVFASNCADTGGGAIYFSRDKKFLPAVVITYSTFSTNLAKYGSALYFDASYTSLNPPLVTSNLFKDNTAYAGGTFFMEDTTVSNLAVVAYTKEAVTTTFSKTKLTAVTEEKLMDTSFITRLLNSNTFVNNVAPYGAQVASSPAQLKYSSFSSSTSNDVSQIIAVNENNGLIAFPSFTIVDAFGTVVNNVTYMYQVNISSSSINSKTACSPGSSPAGKLFGETTSKRSVYTQQQPVQLLNVKAHCYPNRTMIVKVSVVFPDLQSSLWTIFALNFLPCPNKFVVGSNDVCVPIESQPTYLPSLNTVAFASSNDSALSTSAVIGIAVGCVIVLILLILFIGSVTYSMHRAKHKSSPRRGNADYIQNKLNGDISFSSSMESVVYVNGLKSFRLTGTDSMNSSFTMNGSPSASQSENDVYASGTQMVLYVPYIDWNDVEMVDNRKDKVIIGKGSYGSVIKAKVNTKTEHGDLAIPDDQVVIKIIDKSLLPAYDIDNHHKNLLFAMKEVKVLLDAEARIIHKDCIIKVYGIAVGNLPVALSDFFNVADYTNAIGIVMRYERGGSLNSLIHRNNSSSSIRADVSGAGLLLTSGRDENNENEGSTDSSSSQGSSASNVSIVEKIRILSLISKGLAELHSVGIVHGDIKPDNILLSHHDPPQVRLADFGLASLREDKGDGGGLGQSTLIVTEHAHGTPIYCAPEMLINVHVPGFKISKASRKTDMYAFAILMWEVITEKRPFHWVKDEVTLCSIVHQGGRPAITDISGTKYPDKIKNLITSSWDHDRTERKTAIECFATLQYCHGYLAETDYDVYLLCHPSDTFVSNHIFHRLMQNGLNVQQSNELTTQQGSNKSKIVIACLNEKFQADTNCLKEVKSARETIPRRPVIALFLQLDQDKWVDGDTYYTCQMRDASTTTFDISNVLSQSPPSLWNEEGPDKESKIIFHNEIDRLTDYIKKRIGFY